MSPQIGQQTSKAGTDAEHLEECSPKNFPVDADDLSSDTDVETTRVVYLIVDGIAGFGAINGECFVEPLPTGIDALATLLLGQAAHELGMRAADRCNAVSLGKMTAAEIATIPDRPAALSAWFVEIATKADPRAFRSLEKALDALCQRDERKPEATFAVDTVRRYPRATAEFLLSISETTGESRTTRSPASLHTEVSALLPW